jgi:hypothetical protein
MHQHRKRQVNGTIRGNISSQIRFVSAAFGLTAGNAARNIRTEGLRLLVGSGVLGPKSMTSLHNLNNNLHNKLAQGYGESQNGCGERVRLPMGAALVEAARSPSA